MIVQRTRPALEGFKGEKEGGQITFSGYTYKSIVIVPIKAIFA